jgi:hypothetical protein
MGIFEFSPSTNGNQKVLKQISPLHCYFTGWGPAFHVASWVTIVLELIQHVRQAFLLETLRVLYQIYRCTQYLLYSSTYGNVELKKRPNTIYTVVWLA